MVARRRHDAACAPRSAATTAASAGPRSWPTTLRDEMGGASLPGWDASDVNIVLTREAGHNETLRSLVPDGADVVEVPLTTTRYFVGRATSRAELRASPTFGALRRRWS